MTRQGKPGPVSRIARKDILQAARRHYDHGETQSSIAKDMGISASYLARLLKMAKDNGWVRVFVDADRETELAAALKEKYPHLVHVEVVPSGPTPEATARALGTVAATWLNDLLDRDEESGNLQIWNIAVGGGMVHREMVDQVVPRQNRISVGPTALTPATGRMARFTAPTVATLLALRLGALPPGARAPDAPERSGYLYDASVETPPATLSKLRTWFAQLENRPEIAEMQTFWARVDLAFVSVVGVEWLYGDIADRLNALGISLANLRERGATVLLANQFVDAHGALVPLAPGVPGYQPAIPPDLLRDRTRRKAQTGSSGCVVLDAWGAPGVAALPLLTHGLATVLLCDTQCADRFLTSTDSK